MKLNKEYACYFFHGGDLKFAQMIETWLTEHKYDEFMKFYNDNPHLWSWLPCSIHNGDNVYDITDKDAFMKINFVEYEHG